MEVKIRIEVLAMEAVQLGRPLAGNVLITKVLADNSAIFGFGQGIVIGVARGVTWLTRCAVSRAAQRAFG